MGKAAKNPTTKKIDIGTNVKIINLSDNDQFCHFTGKILPKKGFAWKYKDLMFVNRAAALDYERNLQLENEQQ